MQDLPIISIIGPGVMAEAIIAGLIRQQVANGEGIRVAGPNPTRLQELNQKYGVVPFRDNRESVQGAQIVVLAVKPQRLEKVLEGLHGAIHPEALVISIVAGATIQKISSGLGHPCVVRSMPNTPAQIGQGITVWTDSAGVSAEQRDQARQILSALGKEIYLEEENYLDMATALSGTGPAYVFLFMEALIDAGVHLGFPRRIAEELVTETLRGSVNYYDEKKSHIARLRNEVTSPGGTSAAALYYLEKAGFRTAVSRAIWAAYERSLELGRGKSTQSPEDKT